MSLSLVSKDDEHCFQTIAENNSNWKRVSCKKWSYTYPHGYTETWVNEVSQCISMHLLYPISYANIELSGIR